MEITFERHDVVNPIQAGAFIGIPDAATQVDFYDLANGSQRSLDLIVKDESGNIVREPGLIRPVGPTAVPASPSSGRLDLMLVPDSSADVVFDSSTPADGTVFNWKVDTFTVAITGQVVFTVIGAPFSPMTASGTIIFSDETTTSPLPSQTTAYSISIPGAGIGTIGTAATGPKTFNGRGLTTRPLEASRARPVALSDTT